MTIPHKETLNDKANVFLVINHQYICIHIIYVLFIIILISLTGQKALRTRMRKARNERKRNND